MKASESLSLCETADATRQASAPPAIRWRLEKMERNTRPAPAPPFQKENGKWTFYDYPKGVETEAGEYETETEAKAAFITVHRLWVANNGTDGPINAVIN